MLASVAPFAEGVVVGGLAFLLGRYGFLLTEVYPMWMLELLYLRWLWLVWAALIVATLQRAPIVAVLLLLVGVSMVLDVMLLSHMRPADAVRMPDGDPMPSPTVSPRVDLPPSGTADLVTMNIPHM